MAVLCPSRGRPKGLQSLIDSVRQTSEAQVYAYVDDDWAEEYNGIAGAEVLVGPRIGPVKSANALVERLPPQAAYGFLADDMTVTVKGWDKWVLDAIAQCPNRICVVAPEHNLGEMVDVPFVSREWIEAVGWFACPALHHWCWPTVTALIGGMTAMAYAPKEAFYVHHHATIHENNMNHRDDDNRQFFEYVSLRLPGVVERLRQAMYPLEAVK